MAPERSDSATFKAIADPTRRAILEALARRELAVREIAAGFAMSRPAVSKHLRILKEAGLLSERRRGRQNLYRLEPGPLAEVEEWLAGCRPGRPRPAPARERRERKARRPARTTPARRPADDWRVW